MQPVCPFVERECTPACRAYMAREGKEWCGVISAMMSLSKPVRELVRAFMWQAKEEG